MFLKYNRTLIKTIKVFSPNYVFKKVKSILAKRKSNNWLPNINVL